MKNLVLAVVGDESLHWSWIQGNPNFHLYLIYYGKHKDKYKTQCDYYLQQQGSKYFIYHELIQKNKDFFFGYDAIWMPDDDIYLKCEDVNKLFNLFHNPPPLIDGLPNPEIVLAQPSIMGWYSLWITLHNPQYVYRFTNFVEIMCPIFNKEALMKLWPTFIETKSSWGLDMIWDYKLGHPRNKIAIFDEIIALHTREVKSGDLYINETKNNPYIDLEYVAKKYGLSVHELNIYGGKKCQNL